MSYGKVISGGARMTKGLTKGINDKLDGKSSDDARREVVAGSVRKAFSVGNLLSDPHTQNIKGGSFKKPSVPSKV